MQGSVKIDMMHINIKKNIASAYKQPEPVLITGSCFELDDLSVIRLTIERTDCSILCYTSIERTFERTDYINVDN